MFEAQIEDVSRADAPATIIGSTRVEAPGQVPIRFFSIAYDPARVEANRRYVVRARIVVADTVLFSTDSRRLFPASAAMVGFRPLLPQGL